jgi:hypothetical protein
LIDALAKVSRLVPFIMPEQSAPGGPDFAMLRPVNS